MTFESGPDSVVPMSDQEENDLRLRRQPGAIEALDEAVRERVKTVRDAPLERALDYLRGMQMLSEQAAASGRA